MYTSNGLKTATHDIEDLNGQRRAMITPVGEAPGADAPPILDLARSIAAALQDAGCSVTVIGLQEDTATRQ